jgi:hypothetical protein
MISLDVLALLGMSGALIAGFANTVRSSTHHALWHAPARQLATAHAAERAPKHRTI